MMIITFVGAKNALMKNKAFLNFQSEQKVLYEMNYFNDPSIYSVTVSKIQCLHIIIIHNLYYIIINYN